MRCNECGYDGHALVAKIEEALSRLDVVLWEYQLTKGEGPIG